MSQHVEMVIVPDINRIVRFGRPGGPNLLWVDPEAENGPAMPWKNWGGEKLWFWPQERWPELGSPWPPPMDPGVAGEMILQSDGLDWLMPGSENRPTVRREVRVE